MGRTIPAVTQLIFEQIEEARPLYEAVRRSDQLKLDEIFASVIQHKAALSNSGTLSTLEVMLLLVLLEQHKRMDTLRDEIRADVRNYLVEIHPSAKGEVVMEGGILDEDPHGLAA